MVLFSVRESFSHWSPPTVSGSCGDSPDAGGMAVRRHRGVMRSDKATGYGNRGTSGLSRGASSSTLTRLPAAERRR